MRVPQRCHFWDNVHLFLSNRTAYYVIKIIIKIIFHAWLLKGLGI